MYNLVMLLVATLCSNLVPRYQYKGTDLISVLQVHLENRAELANIHIVTDMLCASAVPGMHMLASKLGTLFTGQSQMAATSDYDLPECHDLGKIHSCCCTYLHVH